MSCDHGLEVRTPSLSTSDYRQCHRHLQLWPACLNKILNRLNILHRGRCMQVHFRNQLLRNKQTKKITRNISLWNFFKESLFANSSCVSCRQTLLWSWCLMPVFCKDFLLWVKCYFCSFKGFRKLTYCFSLALRELFRCVIPAHPQPHTPTGLGIFGLVLLLFPIFFFSVNYFFHLKDSSSFAMRKEQRRSCPAGSTTCFWFIIVNHLISEMGSPSIFCLVLGS